MNHGKEAPMGWADCSDGESDAEPGLPMHGVNPVEFEVGIAAHLREHQHVGVRFALSCFLRGGGCILADEMGLGKTLQSIAVVFTLMSSAKQCNKVLILSPASLIGNWCAEFSRWLGKRCAVNALDAVRSENYKQSAGREVLIMSYDMFRRHGKSLHDCVGVVVCDEGHRLKSSTAVITKCVQSLGTHRRLILSGTLVQNNLPDFFKHEHRATAALLLSGKLMTQFRNPILVGQQPSASVDDHTAAETQAQRLLQLTCDFILRRSNSLLAKALPPQEHLFCVRHAHWSPSIVVSACFGTVVGI